MHRGVDLCLPWRTGGGVMRGDSSMFMCCAVCINLPNMALLGVELDFCIASARALGSVYGEWSMGMYVSARVELSFLKPLVDGWLVQFFMI